MSSSAYQELSSPFDPAIHLHSQQPSDAFDISADLLELNQHLLDVREQKTRQGIVIQHRAWAAADAFRSDEDSHTTFTPCKPPRLEHITAGAQIPSSPPVIVMALRASSPITYPATSSPRAAGSPNKRRKLSNDRPPLQDVNANARRGVFMDDESEDDEDAAAFSLFHKHSQRLVSSPRDTTATEPRQPEKVIIVDSLFTRTKLLKESSPDSAYGSDAVEPDASQEVTQTSTTDLTSKSAHVVCAQTTAGRSLYIGERRKKQSASYEQIVASRSVHVEGHAKRSYYGVDMHSLLDDLAQDAKIKEATKGVSEDVKLTVEHQAHSHVSGRSSRTLMWTEKYRARKFTDLVGDERTHRSVLRWLKAWDLIVFPGANKQKQLLSKRNSEQNEERIHRKILLLTGPPGLGKTTLAHVCAKQAGYEVQEINASDERSRDVVRGRIRDMVGTENVRGQEVKTAAGKTRKAGRPVCVIVDEVDGVVGGSGSGGEGGFINALTDLVTLDQKNSVSNTGMGSAGSTRRKKGDKFRMLRPLILICNDVYHPSLRPLRQSSFAEIIHMRKPNLNMVISRVHSIFEKEGVPSDVDGVRRLCEATWGVSTKKEGGGGQGTGEGDIRSVMVVGEWVATKLRASATPSNMICPRLTRKWLEGNILGDLGYGGGAARSLGRGGAKEVVDRVFQEGAGFPKTSPLHGNNNAARRALDDEGTVKVGVTEASKRRAADRLREMIDASGESDRILQDCFTAYPTQPIQDDTFLSKPNAAYDWLHFHDTLSSQLLGSQDWELAPYMSSSILAFHHLFASSQTARHTYTGRPGGKDEEEEGEKLPFSGPGASFQAFETQKANASSISELQSSLSLPLARMYRSPADIASELLPYTLRILAPDVKPVVINSSTAGARAAPTASVRKASEKALVSRAVECMAATGVRFEKSRIEHESAFNRSASGGWVYRMEPPLDALGTYETMSSKNDKGVRYAIRQVLEMEWCKEVKRKGEEMRIKKMSGEEGPAAEKLTLTGGAKGLSLENVAAVKRDFFGRVIATEDASSASSSEQPHSARGKEGKDGKPEQGRVWVSYHEGFSNAVRKPMTLKELMDGL